MDNLSVYIPSFILAVTGLTAAVFTFYWYMLDGTENLLRRIPKAEKKKERQKTIYKIIEYGFKFSSTVLWILLAIILSILLYKLLLISFDFFKIKLNM